MAQTLVAGQNCAMPSSRLLVEIVAGAPADFSSFRLYSGDKVRRDEDFVFYGQRRNDDGTVELLQKNCSALFSVDLASLAAAVEKVAFAVTSEFPTIAGTKSLRLTISSQDGIIVDCPVDMAGRHEAALILGEFYRRSGQWKFRFIAQGFKGGLKPLAEMYGVDVLDDTPPAPADQTVNLSKIVLTKSAPKVDLGKQDMSRGIIRVNLNWSYSPAKSVKRRLMDFFCGRPDGIDLDLAAYVRLKDGSQTIIQALGESFGSLQGRPYVRLMGDDRTGNVREGEWIHINGAYLDEIDEVLIYTFIYSGVPNWRATDAVARIMIPGQPEIETRLSDGGGDLPMCAIARITNMGGKIGIERLDRYFAGHRNMDKAFGWGFIWAKGSK